MKPQVLTQFVNRLCIVFPNTHSITPNKKLNRCCVANAVIEFHQI